MTETRGQPVPANIVRLFALRDGDNVVFSLEPPNARATKFHHCPLSLPAVMKLAETAEKDVNNTLIASGGDDKKLERGLRDIGLNFTNSLLPLNLQQELFLASERFYTPDGPTVVLEIFSSFAEILPWEIVFLGAEGADVFLIDKYIIVRTVTFTLAHSEEQLLEEFEVSREIVHSKAQERPLLYCHATCAPLVPSAIKIKDMDSFKNILTSHRVAEPLFLFCEGDDGAARICQDGTWSEKNVGYYRLPYGVVVGLFAKNGHTKLLSDELTLRCGARLLCNWAPLSVSGMKSIGKCIQEIEPCSEIQLIKLARKVINQAGIHGKLLRVHGEWEFEGVMKEQA